MLVRKNVNLYFTESEVKEALILYMRENGREDMAVHAFENESMLDFVSNAGNVDENGEQMEDLFILCVDGEVDEENKSAKN